MRNAQCVQFPEVSYVCRSVGFGQEVAAHGLPAHVPGEPGHPGCLGLWGLPGHPSPLVLRPSQHGAPCRHWQQKPWEMSGAQGAEPTGYPTPCPSGATALPPCVAALTSEASVDE